MTNENQEEFSVPMFDVWDIKNKIADYNLQHNLLEHKRNEILRQLKLVNLQIKNNVKKIEHLIEFKRNVENNIKNNLVTNVPKTQSVLEE
jgi:hypothetical protein